MLFLFVGFYSYYSINTHSNRQSLGDPVTIRKTADILYRDLNKNARLDIYEDPRRTVDERTSDLLSQMTLAEKAGSMFITMIAVGLDGEPVERPDPRDLFSVISPTNSFMLGKQKMNHFNVVFLHGAKNMAIWQNNIQLLAERSRLGIPVTIASDPRHAFGLNPAASLPAEDFSLWPEPLGMAATRDPKLLHQFGDMARQEYLAVGIRLALHPMADLATEPRWARAAGTFGEDANLSAKLVHAYIKGFQGDVLGPNSVATMVKHFSGGGPQQDGEDAHFPYGREQVYPGDQFDYHLIPFVEGAFKANTAQIMPYYGIPLGQTSEDVGFAFNKEIITDLLRDKYQFDGVICSDWGLITDTMFFGRLFKQASAWGVEHLTPEERMFKLLTAGIDQFGGEHNPELLIALVESGRVPESRLDASVTRLMRDKFRLGLFDNPMVDVSKVDEIVGRPDFMSAGQEAQRKSAVLLKNAQSTLPLTQRKKVYVENIPNSLLSQYADLVETPEEADFAIIRLAAPYYPHEGLFDSRFHSGDLDFKSDEKDRLLSLMQTVPTIIDIYLDRAAVIPELAQHSAALIANFGLTDELLLQLIWGQYKPTGKLPFELPSSMEAVVNQLEDVPYDSNNPLYMYGHGLTYP